MSDTEKYPVSEQITVLDGETIYKNDGWWKAVVASESFGSKSINIYLWKENSDGSWSRKQKYKVSNENEWQETESVINEFIEYL